MKHSPMFPATNTSGDQESEWHSQAVATAAPITDHIIKAERALVGAIIKDNSLYANVLGEIAGEASFLDVGAGAVFCAIQKILEKEVPGIAVAEAMTVYSIAAVSKNVGFDELENWVKSAPIDSKLVMGRARIIQAAAAERGLGDAMQQAQLVLKNDASTELKSEEILKLLSGVSAVRSLPVKGVGAAALEALGEMVARAESGNKPIGLLTGIDDLDAMTTGFQPGQLIVIAARPGVGKTAFALTALLNMANDGHCVLMASMEMKAAELAKRAMSLVSGVDSQAIRTGALTELDWENLARAGEVLGTLPLDIVDLPTVNLSALNGLCRRLHAKGKLKALVVDYLQIMSTDDMGRLTMREQQISTISRGLKMLAMNLGIPVIALSQLNRDVEKRIDKRPTMADLRESGAIEQDADVIMFLYQDEKSISKESDVTIIDIILAKQRSGPTGDVQARFRKSTTEFSNLAS